MVGVLLSRPGRVGVDARALGTPSPAGSGWSAAIRIHRVGDPRGRVPADVGTGMADRGREPAFGRGGVHSCGRDRRCDGRPDGACGGEADGPSPGIRHNLDRDAQKTCDSACCLASGSDLGAGRPRGSVCIVRLGRRSGNAPHFSPRRSCGPVAGKRENPFCRCQSFVKVHLFLSRAKLSTTSLTMYSPLLGK